MFSRPTSLRASSLDDDLLSAYLDGEVTAAERARVEQTLASDSQAREQLQALEATVQLLREAPRVAVPRVFTLTEAQVVAAGGKVKGGQQSGWLDRLFAGLPRLMPVATAAVALALLLVVGLDVWSSQFGAAQPPWRPFAAMEVNEATGAAPAAKAMATMAPMVAEKALPPETPTPATVAQVAAAEAPVDEATVVVTAVVTDVVTDVVTAVVTDEVMASEAPAGTPEAVIQIATAETPVDEAAPIVAAQTMSMEMSALEAPTATASATANETPTAAPTEAPATQEAQRVMVASPTASSPLATPLPSSAPAPLEAVGAGVMQEAATPVVQAAAQPRAEAASKPAAPPATQPAAPAPSSLRSLELILGALLAALALLTLLTRRPRALR